jgi:uncharacterized membrane protein YphA (DoxX/SURF4 family)
MEYISLAPQIALAFGIFNVWLLRQGKPSQWRGGSAMNMKEEFQYYGLPIWLMKVVKALKLSLALGLVIGFCIPVLTKPSAFGITLLMVGAILMHVKVKDPIKKSVPAATMLLLSLAIMII